MADPDLGELLQGPLAVYRNRLRTEGIGPGGVCWRDAGRQGIRFDMLLGAVARHGRSDGLSLADFGCGYGALYDHIEERGKLRLAAYHGIDACPEMISAARTRIGDRPNVHLAQETRLPVDVDYTVVSGTFNLKLLASDAAWDAYIKRTLAELWERSRYGLAFNLLSRHDPQGDGSLFLADPGHYLGFCLREFSDKVLLRHDYLPDDFTIWVFR